MAIKKADLKALASHPLAGFKHKKVLVPEFDNAEVILREPSAGAWLAWQEKYEKLKIDSESLSISAKAQIQLEADVLLFISVFCDDDGYPVFAAEDEEQVRNFYGPVHSRLVKEALDLLTPVEDLAAK